MEIRFGGILHKDEMLQVYKLTRKPITAKPHLWIEVWVLILITGLLLAVGGIWLMRATPDIYMVGFIITIVGIFIAGVGFKSRNAIIKLWERQGVFTDRREVLVTEDHMEINFPTGQSRLLWSHFSGYGEYQEILVLYQDKITSYPFPKRFFQNDEDWYKFKEIVAKKLPLTHRIDKINHSEIIIWLLLGVSAIIILLKISGVLK